MLKENKQQQPKLSTATFVNSLQFMNAAGAAGWGKFSSLFFLQNGITPSQLAILGSVRSITKFIGYPTFGILADFFGDAKSLLLSSLIISNVILLLFYAPYTKTIIFDNFALLVFVRALRSYCNSIWLLIDAVTMKLIIDKKSYGKHRLYCSIAWGTSSLVAGRIIDIYGMDMVFVYTLAWRLAFVFLVYFGMPSTVENYEQHKYQSLSTIDFDEEHTIVKPHTSEPKYEFCQIFTLLASIRHDHQFIYCILLMLIYWHAMFIIERMLFIQMDQEFGATKTMMGIATLCTTVAEVPFFYYSNRFLKRFSMNKLFAFCHVVLIIRLLSYLLCKDVTMVWIIYIIEFLHGINFGLGFTVCRVYLYQMGEDYSVNNDWGINVRATIQSLKGLIILFSSFIGSLVWLPLYDKYNAQTVYIYGAMTLGPSIIILWFQTSSGELFNVLK
eukprot:257858_1